MTPEKVKEEREKLVVLMLALKAKQRETEALQGQVDRQVDYIAKVEALEKRLAARGHPMHDFVPGKIETYSHGREECVYCAVCGLASVEHRVRP